MEILPACFFSLRTSNFLDSCSGYIYIYILYSHSTEFWNECYQLVVWTCQRLALYKLDTPHLINCQLYCSKDMQLFHELVLEHFGVDCHAVRVMNLTVTEIGDIDVTVQMAALTRMNIVSMVSHSIILHRWQEKVLFEVMRLNFTHEQKGRVVREEKWSGNFTSLFVCVFGVRILTPQSDCSGFRRSRD